MIKQVNVILGLGFGDEGKGRVVSRLCRFHNDTNAEKANEDCLVIRFSGGFQSGHTVVLDGKRHIFSSFGSGTLQNVPTYWTRFCPVYPIALINEYKVLRNLGVMPKILIDGRCPITTPYDVLAQRKNNTNINHGTCGVGIGTTIQRQEDMYKLHFMDLFNETILMEKLSNIKIYYGNNNVNLKEFFNAIKMIKDENIGFEPLTISGNLIFEGSQGILLDQDFGFFPNVTRGNTTMKNALSILDELYNWDIYGLAIPFGGFGLMPGELRYYPYALELHYVTRTYQTRHGYGFMSDERDLELKNNEHETNVFNQWQKDFRTGNLDINLIDYAIHCNESFLSYPPRTARRTLEITCTDQFDAPLEEMGKGKEKFDAIYKYHGPETFDETMYQEAEKYLMKRWGPDK